MCQKTYPNLKIVQPRDTKKATSEDDRSKKASYSVVKLGRNSIFEFSEYYSVRLQYWCVWFCGICQIWWSWITRRAFYVSLKTFGGQIFTHNISVSRLIVYVEYIRQIILHMYTVGVKIRNLKVNFKPGVTWHWVGQ